MHLIARLSAQISQILHAEIATNTSAVFKTGIKKGAPGGAPFLTTMAVKQVLCLLRPERE